MTHRIETPRLTLIAVTAALCEAELAGTHQLGRVLGAALPADWPPSGGEYDRDAFEFYLA